MMGKLLQSVTIIFILTGVSLATWYAGGVVLVIIFTVIGLVSVILIAFMLGSRWTFKTMKAGAELAIESSNHNDRNDAVKTQALAALVREAVKQFKTELPPPAMQLPAGFPPTQPLLGPGQSPEKQQAPPAVTSEHRQSLSSLPFSNIAAGGSRTFIIQGLDNEDNIVGDNGHHPSGEWAEEDSSPLSNF